MRENRTPSDFNFIGLGWRSRSRSAALVVTAAVATATSGGSPAAHGKTFDNNGGAGGLAYLTNTNWNDDLTPTASDDVVFDNSLATLTAATVTLGGAATANSWTFGSGTGTPLGAFAVNSSAGGAGGARTITLGSGNITVDSSVTAAQAIGSANGNLTFASNTGTLTLTNNGAQTLTLGLVTGGTAAAAATNLTFAATGGPITVDTSLNPFWGSLNGGNSSATVTKTPGAARVLTLNGTGVHSFAGNISGANTSSLAVTVNGADSSFSQTLNGVTTFGGNLTVTNGTLVLGTQTSIAGGVLVNGAGGTLLVNGAVAEGGSVAVTAGTIGGSGTYSRTANVARTFNMSAGTKLSPGATAGAAGTLTINYAAATTTNVVDLTAASDDTGAYVFDLGTVSDKLVATTGGGNFRVGRLDFADFTFGARAGFGAGTYVLFDGNSNASSNAGHSLVGTIGNGTGTINGLSATLSIDAVNDDVLLTVVVPEPAGLGALGMLAAGLATRRRRQV